MNSQLSADWTAPTEGGNVVAAPAEYPECRPLTRGPKHHYFGYYDKFPYDITGRYLLALETDFMDRPPTPDDAARIGIVDLEGDGNFEPLDETRAWNWQQGTHLQWLATAPDRKIIYNIRDGDHYAACVHDIQSGDKTVLPLPIYAVSRDGTQAVSINFSRLHAGRPGYGYNGVPDPLPDELHPDQYGIWRMDLQTGEHDLIITLDQIAAIEPDETTEQGKHWVNHLQFSTDDSRFVFLHRWRRILPDGRKSHYTRMFTASPDGSDLYLLNRDDMTSHFDWKSGNEILAWARRFDIGDYYLLFTDHTQDAEIIGEGVLNCDGHCSYSPDGRFILTDTYPQGERHLRTILLYNNAAGERTDIGAFYSPPELQGEIRCDLHPRWNRDGTRVCFDSMHEGSRQMYEIDVSGIVSI
ncbi:MAG: hypothetical protein GX358_03850 [candidate division WS1 bacterium]|nr:hypothetical protein [candidate division WS1 bacterium]